MRIHLHLPLSRVASGLCALATVVAPNAASQSDATSNERATPTFRRLEASFPGPTYWTEGVGFGDVENDGDFDVFFARGEGWSGPGRMHQAGLYLNLLEEEPFRFEDASVDRLGHAQAHGRDVITADVDGDGWVDALFANGFNTAPPHLFMNRGARKPGFFRMESDARGLTEALASSSAAFGDLDDDGDLDLVLADSGNTMLGLPGGRPRLYLNDGEGRFHEDTERLAAPLRAGHMGVHLIDLDQDFDLDVLVPCRTDRFDLGHTLLLNDGKGRFHDASALLPETSGGVYEAEAGDLDGDLDLDLFFISLSRVEDDSSRFPLGEGAMWNRLGEDGELAFDLGDAVGIDDDNEVVLFDHDQDGDLDAFIGSLGSREKVLRNDGGTFVLDEGVIEVTADPTLDLGVCDLDGDGAPDVVTAQGLERIGADQPPCLIYANQGPADTQAPRILTQEELASPSPAAGPWVVHASVQDDVVDDGASWTVGEAWYVLNPEPRSLALRVHGGDEPSRHDVMSGTAVRVSNAAGAAVRLVGEDASWDVAAGGERELVLIRPGTYAVRTGDAAVLASIVVTGSPRRGRALQAGTGFWRFQMDAGEGAAVELCYQIAFTDQAGNRTIAEARAVELTGER